MERATSTVIGRDAGVTARYGRMLSSVRCGFISTTGDIQELKTRGIIQTDALNDKVVQTSTLKPVCST